VVWGRAGSFAQALLVQWIDVSRIDFFIDTDVKCHGETCLGRRFVLRKHCWMKIIFLCLSLQEYDPLANQRRQRPCEPRRDNQRSVDAAHRVSATARAHNASEEANAA
jgi:hypothetical protein